MGKSALLFCITRVGGRFFQNKRAPGLARAFIVVSVSPIYKDIVRAVGCEIKKLDLRGKCKARKPEMRIVLLQKDWLNMPTQPLCFVEMCSLLAHGAAASTEFYRGRVAAFLCGGAAVKRPAFFMASW